MGGQQALYIPESIRSVFQRSQWPRGRIGVAPLLGRAPFLKGMDLEFLPSLDAIAGSVDNDIATTSTLKQWVQESPAFAARLKLTSTGAGPSDLPWLDVDQALVFAGGADGGDDFWLVLDYRSDLKNPRVVGNEYVRQEFSALDPAYKEVNRPRSDYSVYWRELAPSFEAFWQLIVHP